jgi:hypothetical protein
VQLSRELEFPRSRVFDGDYWLRRCEGFHVDCPAGRVGIVVEVRFGSSINRPDALVVRGRMPGKRVRIVSVSEVAEVVPGQERLVLRASPEQGGRDWFVRLRGLPGGRARRSLPGLRREG